jgi:hypothetical protein
MSTDLTNRYLSTIIVRYYTSNQMSQIHKTNTLSSTEIHTNAAVYLFI